MNDIPMFYVVEIQVSGLEWTNDWALLNLSAYEEQEKSCMIAGLGKDEGKGLALDNDYEPHVFRFKKQARMRERVIRRFLRPHGRGWSDTRIAEYRFEK